MQCKTIKMFKHSNLFWKGREDVTGKKVVKGFICRLYDFYIQKISDSTKKTVGTNQQIH